MYSNTLARLFAAVGVFALAAGTGAAEAQTIRAVMHSDLKILDPIWTTAYIVRNHGYMIYDTLLSMDDKFVVQPQMAEKWEVSPDKLTYTFTLREGLLWHDGKPVTSEDVIASIKRWGAKDSMGQKLLSFTREMKAVNDRTFELILKEPYGLVLESLGKPSSNVPFIMPKRVAETPASEQISDFIGSGPFVFKRDEWKPGDKTVYVKFDKYKPRSEPAAGLAGGKKVNVERVEWLAIPDHQTAVNALLAGEIDFIEAPPHDLLPVLKGDESIKLFDWNPLGNQYMFRFNWLHKPFDNQKIRQAVAVAFGQEPFVKAVIGDPAYYKVCKAMFVCGTPLASEHGMERYLNGNIEEAKKLLKESGYDGTPVVLMHSTDLGVLTNLAPVAADMMRRMGLNVDMQSMDWQTLVARRAKKDPPSQGGWNAFLTSWVSADIMNPIAAAGFGTGCDKAWFGWPCDEKMEQLRDQYARETDPAKQKQLAADIQARAMEIGTHINVGQWYQAAAMRKGIVDNMLVAPAPVFWNMTKKD